jgi:hypothetical protein
MTRLRFTAPLRYWLGSRYGIHWMPGGPIEKYLLIRFRIYDRALNEGEIATDKATPIQTQPRPPIAAYSFDEGEGAVAEDLAGEHDGAIEGATWTKGRYGGALSFDGENDCVSVPSSVDLNLTEEFTLAAWVRPGQSQQFTPIFLREGGAEESYSLYLGAFDAGQLEGFVVDGSPGWAEVDSGEALPNKTWSHVAMTSDGDKLRLYVDGETARHRLGPRSPRKRRRPLSGLLPGPKPVLRRKDRRGPDL